MASILIVEDERITARGLQKRLRGMGYAVAGLAATGEEAVRKAAELRPDLVLMDIRLGGGMDGVEAASVIRGRHDFPIVYLTAHSDATTLRRAKVSEPFGYVLKPYGDRDLQTAVEMGLYKHKMESRLRQSEQWLAATLGSIGDAVIACDGDGGVRFMNPVAESLTSWSQADALGRCVSDVFRVVDGEDRRPLPDPALRALATGAGCSLPDGALLAREDGRLIPIEDRAAPIRDANGAVAGVVLVFRDVTERRRLEEHLRQAQKMEALGRLAGGIAHDFNNIMCIIDGYSHLLLRDGACAGPSWEYVRHIQAASERAAALTRQILAFSRKQMLRPRVIDLNAVVAESSAMIRHLIGEHIELVTELEPEAARVEADPDGLWQAILNLAANARDVMPRGGRLTLATAVVLLEESRAQGRPHLKPGRYVMLAVSDTGCGMAEDVLAHVFEPFFTTKEPGHGTGLGLATVHGFVRQSGGHVEVTSAPGQGSTFRIYLPGADGPVPGARAPRAAPAARQWETVLLVEDEENLRRLVRTVLEQRGFRVLEAEHGEQALEVSGQYQGTIHLLLTDLVMPRMGGHELAQRLLECRPGTKVMYMSGYAEDALIQQTITEGGAVLLTKPFGLDELARQVQIVLQQVAVA
jgi:PAS domain S-box-containing protein